MNTFLYASRGVLTFRRFRRTGWALFAALGREVRIGVLTASTLLAASPRLATASPTLMPVGDGGQPAVGDTITLDEANVSASRVPIGAQQAARQVTTLTRDDIAAAGVTAVSDIFKLATSVDVRQRGGLGIQQDISLDGGTFDQTAILINGIPFSNPQTGHNAAQFPFAVSDIERVEVIDGAASRLFGSGAFSGAINVVTRRSERGGEASLQLGSYGTLLATARQAFSTKHGLQTSFSASYRRSDGATTNSDFRGGSLFWQGSYLDPTIRVEMQAGHVMDDFGANTFYSPTNNRQWEATRRTIVSVKAQTQGCIVLSPSAAWTRSTDHYQWIRGTHTAENFNRTDVFHVGLNAFAPWAAGRTAVGAEIHSEQLLSGNLGLPMQEKDWVSIHGQDGIYYTRQAQRTNVDFYVEHNVVWQHITLSAGLLAQRNSGLDHRFRLFPGIDVSYRPNKSLHLYASFNQSLRLPTFTELWYRSPSQEGNVGLRPERNTQYRIGMTWQQKGYDVQAKAHIGRGSDMIDWVMYTPEDVYHAAAFRLRTMGYSVSFVGNLQTLLGVHQPLMRLTASYAFLHQRRHDDAEVFRSNYTMNYLRHKLVIALRHRLFFGIMADWTLRLQNRAGGYQVYENMQPTDRLQQYGTTTLIDLRLMRELGPVALTLDLTNLTARRYVDIAGVPQPGCLVLLGASVKW